MKKFRKLIAIIVANDKEGIVNFLRGEGINISTDATPKEIVKAIFAGAKSDKFRNSFISWTEDRYNKEANFNAYSSASGNFDPMTAQSGGAELNLSGVPSFPDGSPFNDDIFTPTPILGSSDSATTNTGTTKVGDTLRSIDFASLINTGLSAWLSSSQTKQQQELLQTQIEAEKEKIDKQIALGELSLRQGEQQLKAIEAQLKAGGGQNTTLYIVGGVVLLGILGTVIYFATRKK